MSGIVEELQKYREWKRKAEAEMDRVRRAVQHEAHEILGQIEDEEEFSAVLNYIYWDIPELQVAPVVCSSGLLWKDFRKYIKPRPTGVRCRIEECKMEIWAPNRSTMLDFAKPVKYKEEVLCPEHFERWRKGEYRDRWPVYSTHVYHSNHPNRYDGRDWRENEEEDEM